MNTVGFKKWLTANTNYSDRVIGDIVSRLKRADKILSVRPEELYLFELEHTEEFNKISTSVKSQIRKSVKLYNQFNNSK